MMKRVIWFFILILLVQSLYLFSQDRGVKLVVKTKEGKKIELYKGAYAFIVGNGNYKKFGWNPLPGALKDVDNVARVLEKMGYIVTLKKDLDKGSFEKAFTEFSFKYGENINNQILFYYAGHGHTETMANDEEMGYLVMVDTPDPVDDLLGFKLSSVNMQFIVTQAKMMKSNHVLFVFDSCFSGTILNLRTHTVPAYISDNIKHPVRQFITAGRSNEEVPDRSVFKQAFLDLLEGKDKEPIPDGYITGEEMGHYLKQKVPQYNPKQHPQHGKINDPKLDKGDFVFLPKNRYEPPPKFPGVDFSDQEIEVQWSKWQRIFQNDANKVNEYEQNAGIAATSKKSEWERILNTYNHNNPFTDKDEKLRDYAKERIRYWENYKAPSPSKLSLKLKHDFKFLTPIRISGGLDNIEGVGKQYLVLIAINKYMNWNSLRGPVNEAKEIKNILISRYCIDGYLELFDKKADKAAIIGLFRWLQGKLKANDSLLIYYSGRGYLDEYSNEGFFIPMDGGLDNSLMDKWISNSLIKGYISKMKAKHIFLISDSCFAGSLLDISRGKSPGVKIKIGRVINNEYFRLAYSRRCRQVMTVGGFESVPDISEFARQLILVLQENNETYLDSMTLYTEIRRRMKKTMPLFGELGGTGHEEGGIFLFFLREEIRKKQEIMDEKPTDVKAVGSKAKRVYKNDKSFWEAEYEDGIVMVYIPAGEFTMGSNDGEADEKPPHKVYLDGYWMGKTEVTVKQYMKFVNTTKNHYPEWLEKGNKYNVETGTDDSYKKFGLALRGDNYPIIGISWHDASAYCDWLSKKIGLKFKLPTEAQWEKAARGTDIYKFPWGNHFPSGKEANFADKQEWLKSKTAWASKNIDDGYAYTAPIGSYPPGASPYGLLDMAGNVWELCSDWYNKDYSKNDHQKNPGGPANGNVYVLRGGSWVNKVLDIRCSDRFWIKPLQRGHDIGFRLCQDNK